VICFKKAAGRIEKLFVPKLCLRLGITINCFGKGFADDRITLTRDPFSLDISAPSAMNKLSMSDHEILERPGFSNIR